MKTPLAFDGAYILDADGNQADPNCLVRACNAHAALVNALTLLAEKVEAQGGAFAFRDELLHARAALDAAGAA
jgi:hypothetical protein